MSFWVVLELLDTSCIHYVDNVGYGNGSLGDISGEDNASNPRRWWFKNDLLFSKGYSGVKKMNREF